MNGEKTLKIVISSVLTVIPGILVTVLSNIMPMENAPLWMSQMGMNLFYILIGSTVLLALMNILCLVITERTNKDQSVKIMNITYWLIPVISFVACYFTSSYLFGFSDNNEKLMVILFAMMFIVIGNYLPKCKKNTTVGVKVKWALQNNRNWEATHRFCGKLWFFGGFLMAILAFLPGNIGVYGFIVITLVLAFAPVLYSYLFYRKQVKDGSYKAEKNSPKTSKGLQIFSAICVVAIVAAVCVLLFGGKIEYKFRNHYLTVESSFFADMDINYLDIESIELVDGKIGGSRVMGLGTAKLACGAFKSEELGAFTSYRYVGTRNCMILTTGDGETIVLSARSEDETIAVYEELLKRIR